MKSKVWTTTIHLLTKCYISIGRYVDIFSCFLESCKQWDGLGFNANDKTLLHKVFRYKYKILRKFVTFYVCLQDEHALNIVYAKISRYILNKKNYFDKTSKSFILRQNIY